MLRYRTYACIFAVALGSIPDTAGAQPRFVVDGLSFFQFEGAAAGGGLPEGASIPLELEPAASGSWSMTIQPDELRLSPIRYPSGKSVVWKLSAPAKGVLVREGGAWRCSLEAPLVAHVDGRAEGIPFPLRFTTEYAERAAAGFVAARQGARMDPQSGYLQLVAVGVSPTHAATAPGKPFYAVLSGRIGGLPAELSEAAP